jgi:dienelactone hydrolase
MTQTRDRIIDGIPVTEYRDDAGTDRGVFFLVHGHTGERSHVADLAMRFAALGYLAVAVDAYRHGARLESPYGTGDAQAVTMAMPEVVERTCADLEHLARTEYSAFGKYSFSGVSMGGHIAFQMPKRIAATAIAPFIGSPDMLRHYAVTKADRIGLRELEILGPILNRLEIGPDYSAYRDVKIVIANGADDPVVDYRFVADFHDALVRDGHTDIALTLFPCGHEVTADMKDHVLAAFGE